MADAGGPGGVPGHFPQFLPGAPNSAGLLYGDAQVGFVPGDAHADEVMVVSPRLSCAPAPWHFLDDMFHRFQAPAARFGIKVTHAHQPLAVAGDALFGSRHAGSQRQAGLHRVSPRLNAQYRMAVVAGLPRLATIARNRLRRIPPVSFRRGRIHACTPGSSRSKPTSLPCRWMQ